MSRRRPRAIAASYLAGLVGLTGCGGPAARVTLGRQVFDGSCQACHSLVGNESLRRVGGDLLGYRLPRAEMLELVREMPVRRRLSSAETAAVGDYVLGLERSAARGCPVRGC